MAKQLSEKEMSVMLDKVEKYEKMKATAEKARKRRQAKINVLLRKAKAAEITVSEEEIQAELDK